jgi:hypothetical protein
VTPGEATTRIYEQGEGVYVAELRRRFSQGVTGENNAAVLLVRALGPVLLPEASSRVSELSGIGRGTPDVAPFAALDDYMAARRKGDGALVPAAEQRRARAAWRREEDAELSAWVDGNAEALAWAEKASLREKCSWGVVTLQRRSPLWAMVEPSYGRVRELMECLQYRAMRALGEGDRRGAWRDLQTCHRLARLMAQEPTVSGRQVGMRMEEAALACDVQVAGTAGGSAAELAAMERDIAGLAAMPTMEEPLDVTERFMWLDLYASLAREGPAEMRRRLFGDFDMGWAGDPLRSLNPFPVHYEAAMREVNGLFDRAVAAERAPVYADRRAGRAALRAEAERLSSVDEWQWLFWRVDQRMLVRFHPFWNFYGGDQWEEVEERRQLVRGAMALARFRAEHGAYPATLEEAGLHGLVDRFSGEPLVYARRANGGAFVLYSVGLNGRDDQGVVRRESNEATDDLVVTPEGFATSVGPAEAAIRLD